MKFKVEDYKNTPEAKTELSRIRRIYEIVSTERTYYHLLLAVQIVRFFFQYQQWKLSKNLIELHPENNRSNGKIRNTKRFTRGIILQLGNHCRTK
jgi:hypothetical protein